MQIFEHNSLIPSQTDLLPYTCNKTWAKVTDILSDEQIGPGHSCQDNIFTLMSITEKKRMLFLALIKST